MTDQQTSSSGAPHDQDADDNKDPKQDQDKKGDKDDKDDDKKDDDKKGDDKKDDKDDQKASPEKRRKIKIILAVVGVVVLVIGIAWFAYYMLVSRYREETDDAYIQADAVTISPKVGGYVEAVLVRDNQDVQAGQALARIDPRDYTAQADQYRAQIDIAKANADAVRAQIVEQQSAIDAARAQLAAANQSAAFAEGEVRRYVPLVRIGAETAQTLADRRNQAAQARENAAAQRAQLANAEKKIASLRAQVRQAEAQGEVAQAQLKAANVNLQSTTLTASVAGRIGDSTVRLGQFVQPGTRVMTLVPLNTMYISANFKETQIGRMRVGQPVEIKIDALPRVKIRGRVDSVSPGTGATFSLLPPQNATGNFTKIVQRVPVRIAIDASDDVRRILVPGLSVKATVETRDDKDALKDMRDEEKAHQEQENRQTRAQEQQQQVQQNQQRMLEKNGVVPPPPAAPQPAQQQQQQPAGPLPAPPPQLRPEAKR